MASNSRFQNGGILDEVSKVNFRNFYVTFAIGTVATQLHTIKEKYGQNEPNFLLGKTTSNETLSLTPLKY